MRKIIVIILMLGLISACNKSDGIDDVTPNAKPDFKNTFITVPVDYATIQDAINAAPDGCTITVKDGIYPELVSIHYKNNITLIGENAILCPPDGIVHGEGSFNIDIFACSNIIVRNFEFDGKHENKDYPLDRAIAFTFSSGAALNNQINGYGTGIAWHNTFELPCPDPTQSGDMLTLKVSSNNFTNCFAAGVLIIGNYDVDISQNVIHQSYDPDNAFNNEFSHWYAIDLHGGTGIISQNNIKLKTASSYLDVSVGIRLLMRNPAAHNYGMMYYLHDVDVMDNVIKATGTGIMVNSHEILTPIQDPPEEWCVHNVRLLYNKFIQVEKHYEIYNECEEIQILP